MICLAFVLHCLPPCSCVGVSMDMHRGAQGNTDWTVLFAVGVIRFYFGSVCPV